MNNGSSLILIFLKYNYIVFKDDFAVCTAQSQDSNGYKHQKPHSIEGESMLFVADHIPSNTFSNSFTSS